MNVLSTLYARFMSARGHIVDECANLASILRIAGWTLFFTSIIFVIAVNPQERSGTGPVAGFLRPTADGYEVVRDLETHGSDFRMVSIGSSEAFDYRDRKFSLGAALAEEAPSNVLDPIDIIERNQAMLTLPDKADAVARAVSLNADVVVLSIPFRQLAFSNWEQFSTDSEDVSMAERAVFSVLSVLQNPKGTLDSMLSQRHPLYRIRIAGLFRSANTSDTTPAEAVNTSDERIEEDEPDAQDLFPANPAGLQRLIQETYDAASPELIRGIVENVAAPAKDSETLVVVLISPVRTSSLPPRLRELIQGLSEMVDEAHEMPAEDHVIVVNALTSPDMHSSDFSDLIHIRNHRPVAVRIWETLAQEGRLTDLSTEENQPHE